MLHILPVELSLSVLSYLPVPTLCSLPTLSRQWFDLFSTHQSTIFHNAAIFHGYIQPDTILLDDALTVYKGSPWDGATDWKDFCRRCFQLHKNWEGKGRVVARLVTPPGGDIHRFKVDEKESICITTRSLGGLAVTHLFSGVLFWSLPPYYVHSWAHCEYENGYLVVDRLDGCIDVWRLASDFAVDDEGAGHAPPDGEQQRASTFAAAMHHHYAPRGHFRPWAKLSFPELLAYRLAYPTLLCAGNKHAFLYDVHTGALVQTIELDIEEDLQEEGEGISGVCYVDVNERYAFVCEPRALRVFARDGGAEVLRIPSDASMPNVVVACTVPGNSFVAVHPFHPGSDDYRPSFLAAHVSRDGCDLVILTCSYRIVFIRDFERICRGETSLLDAGQVLSFLPRNHCLYIAFEHGRICVSTLYGLYVVNVESGPSIDPVKVVLVRPYYGSYHKTSCVQLTDRRIYFTWDGTVHRPDVPLYEDRESALEASFPGIQSMTKSFHEVWPESDPRKDFAVGCIDFSLMPES